MSNISFDGNLLVNLGFRFTLLSRNFVPLTFLNGSEKDLVNFATAGWGFFTMGIGLDNTASDFGRVIPQSTRASMFKDLTVSVLTHRLFSLFNFLSGPTFTRLLQIGDDGGEVGDNGREIGGNGGEIGSSFRISSGSVR